MQARYVSFPVVLLCRCRSIYSERVSRYQHLLGDIISDIPSSLLAELLHEELIHQKELEHFQPATTGGVLACVPSLECQNEAFLIYPSGEALNTISILFSFFQFAVTKCVGHCSLLSFQSSQLLRFLQAPPEKLIM